MSNSKQLETMPDKQRKQIEFIDEIYNKVVANTSKNQVKPLKTENLEDKENRGYTPKMNKRFEYTENN